MRTRRRADAGATPVVEPYHEPWLAASLAAVGVLALYALSLSPTTWFWDTSEYIATAHIMGIPHPPGNPLFVVFARAWELLLAPTGLSVAVRVNLFSASLTAGAHLFWFLVAYRILAYWSPSRSFRIIGAGAAVLVSATAFTVWNQSNVNEKVYTVTLFTIALLSWLAFRWRQHIGEGKDDNLLVLMVFILALSVGNHLMAFLAAPALLLFILLVEPRTLLNWRLAPAALLVILLGLSIHLFLPIRSGLNPIINEAAPTCDNVREAMVSVVTFGRAGCDNLSAALAREQYDKPSMLLNPIPYPQQLVPRDAGLLVRQYVNYFQWFDWQWARSVRGNANWFGEGLRPLFTLVFIALGLFGAYTHWQRDRISWWYIFTLFGVLAFGLVFYLNFKHGYSDPAYSMGMKEVRERDYFFICSFSVWGLWAGMGVAALWGGLTERLERNGRPRAQLLAAPVLALALIPLVFNWSWANRNYDYSARDWAFNLLNSVEPYGILFTNGDNDTFPLWYAQEVEGIRRDVTVIVTSYLNTHWYPKQLRDLTQPCPPGVSPAQDHTRILCQRPYDVAAGPAVYGEMIAAAERGPADPPAPGARPPTRTILPLEDGEVDQIAFSRAFQLSEDQVFRAGEIEGIMSAGTVVLPADIFMASIINASLDDRPVYFAMTTQAFETLGLRPYLVRHGLANRLTAGRTAVDEASGIMALAPSQISAFLGTYVDVPRTQELMDNVFLHRSGFPDRWGHWVDAATDQIPLYYGFLHYGMMDVFMQLQEPERADWERARGDAFIRLTEQRWPAR
jgi:hypothetical protein